MLQACSHGCHTLFIFTISAEDLVLTREHSHLSLVHMSSNVGRQRVSRHQDGALKGKQAHFDLVKALT